MFSSTHHSISIPPSLSSGLVRSINCRTSAHHLGVPIACQSSDKMDFQLSQGSQVGFCRMGGKADFFCSPAFTDILLVICFSLSISCTHRPLSRFFSPQSLNWSLLICQSEPLEIETGPDLNR
ncbi:hypothetical protein ATANTOWER_014767 [Ataeniobius toweri]|uniref:Uncharacterized protein n=1 Tax=Ataeniobius toweri TaxID=208326 RepID=A0ABU7A8B2_9TELE|nr:hypothetical protein [Ataeniobius toweri]